METPIDFAEPLEQNEVQTIPGEQAEPEATDELQVTDGPEENDIPDEVFAQEQAEEPKKHIFICHRRVEPDQSIASMLFTELQDDFDVYLDTERPVHEEYNEAIRISIEEADVVVALITKSANQDNANWILSELQIAHYHQQESGRPALIPVHLEHIPVYSPRLGTYLGGVSQVDYLGDNALLVQDVRDQILGERRPHDSRPSGMEGFLVGAWRRNLMRSALLESSKMEEASAQLQSENLLWIVGDASIRNYLAFSLAVKEQLVRIVDGKETETTSRIYEVTKSLSWSKVNSSIIRDSIIIFRDVAPSALFDEEKHSNELASLKFLVERNNTIIITTSTDAYPEIQQEIRKQEFAIGASIRVTHDFYGDSEKLFIFDKLLDFLKETGEINSEQHEWARRNEIRENFRLIVGKWSPADIERFVTWHLRQVKRPSDIQKFLQRNADLENEIHSWFISLDDSSRCFVLALALFYGLCKGQLWEKYKLIVETLRQLDANLTLWPLGICRERAALYVTTEGALDFKEERIAEAVSREIARNYREYLIELMPLLEKWSIPPGRDLRRSNANFEERKREAAESREIRAAIARMVGNAGLYGFDELNKLVDRWATDPILQVREAVAISLEQATGESIGTKHVFNLLDKWCNDRTNNIDTLCRTWAAASALGSIAAANPARSIHDKALDRLTELAGDTRSGVRFYVSIPLKKAARTVSLSRKLEDLFSLVIQDGVATTRVNVADALNEARVFDERVALEVLDRWASSESENQRWVAVCSLLLWSLWQKRPDREGFHEIVRFMHQDAEIVAKVFVEITNHKYHKKKAISHFKKFVLEITDEERTELISGLASIPYEVLEKRLLTRLRTSRNTVLENLVVDVQAARWERLLATPNDFINALNQEIRQRRMTVEVYTSLMLLLRPEPEGCRRRLILAFADGFAQNRAKTDSVLKKLKDTAPSTFEPLSVEVRCEVLRQLFHNPEALVDVIAAQIGNVEMADEIHMALEILAQAEPDGNRDELRQAFASSYSLDPQPVNDLLRLFRTTSNRSLRLIAFEFDFIVFEDALSNPAELLQKTLNAMRDNAEWEEAIRILKLLAVSEPRGKRKALVSSLAQARRAQPHEVDSILQHPSFQAQPELAGLRIEVRFASVLNTYFDPSFVTRFFTPAR